VNDPVIIHADGTDCRHPGPPQGTMDDDSGPRCAAGLAVTHVRIGGRVVTLAEAAEMLNALAAAFNAAFGQMITRMGNALGDLGRRMAGDPLIRALTDPPRPPWVYFDGCVICPRCNQFIPCAADLRSIAAAPAGHDCWAEPGTGHYLKPPEAPAEGWYWREPDGTLTLITEGGTPAARPEHG
jgi:hypothetical protein